MEKHLIRNTATVVEAMEALNRLSGETMTLFVTDGEGHLLGSLTDGDIRRALLKGRGLDDTAESICHSPCLAITRDASTHAYADAPRVIGEARKRRVMLLPIVEEGKITSLLDLRFSRGILPVDAVLMAGGMGERLRPLTEKTPKPLLPVNGTPIIDHNISLLRQFGIENIYVSVNYLKDSLKSHLDGTCRIVEEPARLGTIGSVSLISDFSNPHILVMNADLLTDIDLEAMYSLHISTDAWLTMASVDYSVSVPYAIVTHEGTAVTGLQEKPTYNYAANAGIYMLRREAADLIPFGEYMDAPDLVTALIRLGRRVSLYRHDGKWLDIGSPDDYRRANLPAY